MTDLATPHRHHEPTTGLRVDLEFALLKGVLGLMHAVPSEPLRSLVGGIVSRGGMAMPRLRRVGLENLQAAFPERDHAWCEKTLQASFRNLGYLAAELAHFDELNADNIFDVVGFSSAESETAFRELIANRQRLIATAHFGNWELLVQAAGYSGAPFHVVHRSLKNGKVDDLLTAVRGLAGTKVVYKHAAARDVLRLLRKGACVVVPIDQHAPGGSGIPIPFFGRPANTTPGPARLAQIAQVPIQVVVLARVGDSGKHQLISRPPIDPPPRGKDPAALVEVTTKLNEQLEAIIREYPEQWLWMHRRWRVPA
ncbi:MAG: lysophospholipid acyltransferase family protein [Candidatus Binatia bacterium]|nr:lysophospholipid acyltransferase family protein [Candidatus Binatia bacterium]